MSSMEPIQEKVAVGKEGTSQGDEGNHQNEAQGVTDDGTRFVIPTTRDVMSQLFVPWHWTLMQVVTWVFFTLNWAAFFASLPHWCYIALTLFWRMLYNVGLGYVLKQQSEAQVCAVCACVLAS